MKINVYIIWHWVTQKVYISDINMYICKKALRQMIKEEANLKENILHVYYHLP